MLFNIYYLFTSLFICLLEITLSFVIVLKYLSTETQNKLKFLLESNQRSYVHNGLFIK